MDKIVEAQHLSKRYDTKIVFEDVNFSIKSGEVIGLIGANGAGKTTLIKILLGLQTSTTGRVTILQNNPQSNLVKNHIGVMFQDDLVMKRVRGSELIEILRSLYTQPMTTKSLQTIADLGEDINNYVNKLSGGQQRKLNFALALAGDPQLLFLDEPTAGMDTTSRHHFWNNIRQLTAKGKTIIVTSHYLSEIEDVATRILFLKDQHLIHDGSLQSLRQKFNQNTIKFISDLTEEQLQIKNGILESHHQNYYCFRVDNVDQFLQDLAPQMLYIRDLQIQQKSLDDIFRQINEEK
ncbi:ABC transporter ATP-binding protein [Bombilactobacillus bombi]|uniref:ABC transporter ATP-binding protein n=1 Tax=Bombilactobacillus bombi TaxID=1303590 RepID=A0A3R6YRY8_9LACO|nr:ABC transporter ATP-binding protein [Bombilactobacillus bombi]RHW50116.1 ABC transporter ATP-binding protein [Bombilactobacillus bombi]